MRRKRRPKVRMTKPQVEQLSKTNAIKMVRGQSKLKSWGKSGFIKIKRLNKWIEYRSSIEQRALTLLDEAGPYIVDFETECFFIPYQHKGATLNYVPDIILKTDRGSVFIVEVKPASQLKEEKNLDKWAEAKRWAWKNGARFFVITEKDIDNLVPIIQLFEEKDVTKAQSLMEWKL